MPGFCIEVSENFKHIVFDPSGECSGRNFTLYDDVMLSNLLYSSFDSSISTLSEGTYTYDK